MIVEYHRPDLLDDALDLLSRVDPISVPIGGGTTLDRASIDTIAVVDLQALGLNGLSTKGAALSLGACVTLQELLLAIDSHSLDHLSALKKAIRHEVSYNIRQVATLAGTLVSADGRSPFSTAMLALDCHLTLEPGSEQVGLGEILLLRGDRLLRRLITEVSVPKNARLAYEYVARTPDDLPIVCVAAAVWPSGRTRVILGGCGESPMLVFDGNDAEGADLAAMSGYSQAEDPWGSAEYRRETAAVLTKRALESIAAQS